MDDENGSEVANSNVSALEADDTASSVASSARPSSRMAMRSRRRKKRDSESNDDESLESFSSAMLTPSRKRVSKRLKKHDDDLSVTSEAEYNGEHHIGNVRKLNKKKSDSIHLPEEDENAIEVDMGNGQKNGTMLMPPNANLEGTGSTTTSAVTTSVRNIENAIASVDHTDLELRDESSKHKGEENSTDVRLVGTSSLIRLGKRDLRLPSQHTPKPLKQSSLLNESSKSIPPLGRRLVFDSSKKSNAITETSGKKTRNEMLIPPQQDLKNSRVLKSSEQEKQVHVQEGEPLYNSCEVQDSQFYREKVNNVTLEGNLSLYVKRWILLLVSLFIAVSSISVISENGGAYISTTVFSVWDVTLSCKKWESWYGINSEPETKKEEAMRLQRNVTKIVEEYVEVVDPFPLQDVKQKLQRIQAQRRVDDEMENLNNAIRSIQNNLKSFDSLLENWTAVLPTVSKLLSDSISNSFSTHEQDFADDFNARIRNFYSKTLERKRTLIQWEHALRKAEESITKLPLGEMDRLETNAALSTLSTVSLVPTSATLLDTSNVVIPGEECMGKDYILTNYTYEEGPENQLYIDAELTHSVGAIDVNALDYMSHTPVRLHEAQAALSNVLKIAQVTMSSFVDSSEPSLTAQQWIHDYIHGELITGDVEERIAPITDTYSASIPQSSLTNAYTKRDALIDIDRLLENEASDRTGKFDYASVINGATVVRRGPYATTLSLYETLPLLNRLMAFTKIKFHGYPPEMALRPTMQMYSRGQCWAFQNESSNQLTSRVSSRGEIRGEYATLTVKLKSAIMVSQVVIEHIPSNLSSNIMSAVKDFRVLGFEDTGAFGEPWELGTFLYDTAGTSTIQVFELPQTVEGIAVPKLKAVTLAVDSNWGADFACLYRFRVHEA